MVVLALLEVAGILTLSGLAMSVAAPETVLSNPRLARVINSVDTLRRICADPRHFVLFVALVLVALTIVKNATALFVGVRTSGLGEQIALFAGKSILTHYLHSPYTWHLSGDSTEVFQSLTWKIKLGLIVVHLLNVYTYAIIATALFVTLISATPDVVLSALTVTGSLTFAIYRGLKKSVDHAGAAAAAASSDENRAILSAMKGIREVIIYRQQATFAAKYLEACERGIGSRIFLNVAPPLPAWILEVVGFALIPATILLLITFRNANMATIAGSLAMVMLVAWRILPMLNRSLSSLIAVRSNRAMAFQCLERVEHAKSHHVTPLPDPDPAFCFRSSIRLQHVWFTYPGASSSVIRDVTMTIPKGRRVGIVGPSGSGKSTIAGLISGLMEPTSGRLEVDGEPLTSARLAAYIMRVGYVPQLPYILSGTVAENVAFSQWGKPYDPDLVWKACRMAALDIVDLHEKGILIPVGDHGAGLSAGQAQRVSIARALYANPEVLILDEATSSLDQGTEAAIMRTIEALPGTITTIVIAHRLSTVERCDHVVWIEQGRVMAEGSPNAILPRYLERLRPVGEETSVA